MSHEHSASAEVMWHSDEEEPPEDWSRATEFPTLGAALEAIFAGTPQTGHPWIRCGDRIFAPHDIETLWQEPDEF